MLYDMTDGDLVPVDRTTFAAQHVLERAHLQRALRDRIEVLGEDLLVVAEEFGDFEDSQRRIDLLCVDRDRHLVVVEIKRTEDGGHMELQALRYAAMVSTMTMDELEHTLDRHLEKTGRSTEGPASEMLAQWFAESDSDEAPVVKREVRIILVSADFGREITTTVLWLNDLYSTDIRCIRLAPYFSRGRLLLDVQQVIPLPEAEALTIQLKRREQAVKAAVGTSGADWTPYVITTPAGETPPLRKRRAILAMVEGLIAVGVPPEEIQAALPKPKLLSIEGDGHGDALVEQFLEEHRLSQDASRRWFFDHSMVVGGRTWVLSKMWGLDTEPALRSLRALAPEGQFDFRRMEN